MVEVAVIYSLSGLPLYWYEPKAGCGAIPDAADLWGQIWLCREDLAGVAHTHPGGGFPGPSPTDLTTFAAIEAGLGQRLDWPIVTKDEVASFTWRGPGRLDYGQLDLNYIPSDIVAELRRRSSY